MEPDKMLLAPDNIVLWIPLIVELHETADAFCLALREVEAIHLSALNTRRIVGFLLGNSCFIDFFCERNRDRIEPGVLLRKGKHHVIASGWQELHVHRVRLKRDQNAIVQKLICELRCHGRA